MVLKTTMDVTNIEPVLRALLDRGHHVTAVIVGKPDRAAELRERYAEELPGLVVRFVPGRRGDRWAVPAAFLRRRIDDAFARRRENRVQPALLAVLRAVERAVPPGPEVEAIVRERRPDRLVVMLPLGPASDRVDFLRASRALGAATVYASASWKSLTGGLLLGEPDLVVTANAHQRAAAIKAHGIAPERVVAAGAPGFDHWAGWQPERSREELSAQARLDPGRPYVLYVCSALRRRTRRGDGELPLLRDWVARLRAADDPRLREAGILVRPHPGLALPSDGLGAAGESVAVWPATEGATLDERRSSLFDSIHHAAVVVGVNTSAFVDAALIGRPCVRMALPGDEALPVHLRHLAAVGEGVLTLPRTPVEQDAAVARALAGQAPPADREAVARLVRPRGGDTPAAVEMAQAIEGAAPSSLRRRRRRPATPGRRARPRPSRSRRP